MGEYIACVLEDGPSKQNYNCLALTEFEIPCSSNCKYITILPDFSIVAAKRKIRWISQDRMGGGIF
jgi:hypothetical protein